MADVESLELQIKGNASGATRSLNNLIDTLEKLEKATEGGCGLNAVSKQLQKIANTGSRAKSANNTTRKSFSLLNLSALSTYFSLDRVAGAMLSWVNESSEYTENVNLFTVSMGEYADAAMEYANTVSAALGIDPSTWIRNQGIFMTMGTGFGVAGDRAAYMSQRLTQLGYDLASYYDLDVNEAMNKVKSGFAGELEPLRSLGYDLSQARLQAVALELGITKSFTAMTQAEKAQLRYYAIITQVTSVQGDMSRTIESSANQMRIFKAQVELAGRALGDMLVPVLQKVLPYAIAAVKVFRELVNIVAKLFGGEITTSSSVSSAVGELSSGAADASESVDETTDSVKKLKKMLLGIDELNVLPDPSSKKEKDDGTWVDFELPDYQNDFISESFNNQVDEIVEKMKEWLGITEDITTWSDLFKTNLGKILLFVGLIAVGLMIWTIIKGVASVVDVFGKIKGIGGSGGTDTGDVTSVSKWTGKLKNLATDLGLGLVVILEVAAAAALIIGAIWLLGVELEQVGIAWEPVIANAETITIAMTLGTALLVAVGVITSELGKKGSKLATDMGIGIGVLAEIGVAAGLFIAEIWAIGWGLEQVGKAWQPVLDNGENIAIAIGIGTGILVAIGVAAGLLGVATTATGGTLPLAIGIGTAMLVELGLAAGVFIAEIWAIGYGLNKISEAWGPVHENGDEIKEDIVIGTALLVGVGIAAAALGTATVATAGALPVAIAIGTGVLVELAMAFVEFTDSLVEVADQLKDKLHPSLNETVDILPGLSDDMDDFTSFMSGFAKNVVKFTATNVISGIAATVDKVVGIFTSDPIERLTDEITDQHGKMKKLVDKLNEVIPVIQNAERLMASFNSKMSELKATTGNGNAPGSISYTITVGVKLAKSGWSTVENWIGNLTTTLKVKLPTITVDWSKSSSELKVPTLSAKYYAQGGYPESGELFWARENGAGPELVGSIGNRSAVANNDQIVTAVSQGVYQAVSQAMTQSSGNQTVEAKVNDKVLFEVLVNRARQETVRKGFNPLLGGV